MRKLLLVSFTLAALASPGAVTFAQQTPKGTRLADIAWPEAELLLGPDSVVVIPLGAGAQEHGPHLTLGNDLIIADYLTRRVLDVTDVVAAPPLTYHYFPAFIEYPGSTTLTADSAARLTTEVALSLARFGPRRFYVLNTGIEASRALEPAMRALAAQGILLGFTDIGARLDQASARLRQEEGGAHAGEVETSMMLYIDPASVDMRRAVKDFAPSTGPLRLTRTPGAQGTYSASGVWGSATLATRDKGQVVVESLVKGILDDIETIRHAPLPNATATEGPPRPVSRAAGGPGSRPEVPGPNGCSPGDERIIRRIGDAYTLHWSNADAEKLAGLWASQGDVVHPDGFTERGSLTIQSNRAALFLRPEYRGSKHPLVLGNIRCLTSDVAVADGKWEMRGLSDPTGKVLPTFEGFCTLVVKRAGGGWAIEAYRYTQKPAAAPMPALLKRPGYPGGQ